LPTVTASGDIGITVTQIVAGTPVIGTPLLFDIFEAETVRISGAYHYLKLDGVVNRGSARATFPSNSLSGEMVQT
jgi:hypothetical protein